MSLTISVEEIVEIETDPLLQIHPSWGRVRLGDVATVINGYPFKSKLFNKSEEGMPLIRIRNVVSGETESFTTEEYDPLHVVTAGDLLVGMDGDFNSARWTGRDGLLNQRVCKIVVQDEQFEPRFLDFVLPGYLAAIHRHTSSVTVKHLSSKSIRAIPLPLPPLSEQRRIVDALEAAFADLDAGVAAIEAAQRDLDRYRRSVLKAAVEGALTADWRRRHPDAEPASALLDRVADERRAQWEADQLAKYEAKGKTPPTTWRQRYKPPAEPDLSDAPELPDGWAWASLDSLAALEARAITDGPFGSNLKTAHYTDVGPRVIRLQNIGDGEFVDVYAHISQEHFETLEKHHVGAGDLVIASLGEELPRACVVPATVGPALVKADCIRFKPNGDAVLTPYVLFALNAPPTRQRTTDSIHGVGRPRLNLGKLRAVALPVPPLAEQAAIVAAVDERLSVADAVAQALAQERARADRLRRAVLQRAFAGALVPQAPAAPAAPAAPSGHWADRDPTVQAVFDFGD